MADRCQAFISLSTDCFWEVDAEGRYTYVSPAVADVLGYAPEDLLGRQPCDLCPEYEAQRIRPHMEELQSRREPFAELERVCVHKNGDLVLLVTTGVPVLDDQGRLQGYRGFDRDITEKTERLGEVIRITNELSLERSLESLYRRAVELGRPRLGFSRMSIWMAEGPGWLRGTYGTDEQGDTRCERDVKLRNSEQTQRILERRLPYLLLQESAHRNGEGHDIGCGSTLAAPIWYADLVSGVINADNHLGGRPFTSNDGEILALYASAIGHLIPRVRAEAKLDSIRGIVGRSPGDRR